MTSRLMHRVIPSLVVLLALLLLVAACGTAAPTANGTDPAPSTTTTTTVPPPAPASGTDPAIDSAAAFQLAHCQWDWRTGQQAYLAAQQSRATGEYAAQLATTTNPASWEQEVVGQRQIVTCAVDTARRVPNAPSTSTRVYVRITSTSHVVSTLGSFDTGTTLSAWVVDLVSGSWLVSGTFEGG